MKKLFTFINMILAMLSAANKEIIKLREELRDIRRELEDASKLSDYWQIRLKNEYDVADEIQKERNEYREAWFRTLDKYEELCDQTDSYMEKYNIYEREAKEEERKWIEDVCYRYPTEEEKHSRWYNMMEAKGYLSAYEANMDYDCCDPYNDPDEQYGFWCLKNNLKRNDFEAKKYEIYFHCSHDYCHEEPDIDDKRYLSFVEETLGFNVKSDCDGCCKDQYCDYCEVPLLMKT